MKNLKWAAVFILASVLCSELFCFSSDHERCLDKLAPASSFRDFHTLLMDACNHLYKESFNGKRRVNIFNTKIRFSIQPNQEAWGNLLKVKDALGTPEEYAKPLTSESYDEIIQEDTLQALSKSFVSFFPAFDSKGNFTSFNNRSLRILVESIFWGPERRRKAFIDKKDLEVMKREMDDAKNPGTLGVTWSGGTWRRNMMLFKDNILTSRYKKNKVFPLSVFLHELVHALPGYKDTMFNDTLAFAFLAFLGVDIADINEFNEGENKMKDIDLSGATPFIFLEVYDDIKKIVQRTNFVHELSVQTPVNHTFLSRANGYRAEPYLMNRHIGTYIGKRFQVVYKKLLEDKRVDSNSAYILAKDDMLETLRLTFQYLINELPKEHYKEMYGRTKEITVQSFPHSKEKILYQAA